MGVSVNTVVQDINVQWNSEESEYYTLIPIDNQTLKVAINVYDWTDTTIYGNIYIQLYTKRKHKQRDMDNCTMTGLNPLKTVAFGMKAFKKVEDAFLREYNEDYRVIISCNWTNNHRRDAYYAFLSKRGYHYGNLAGKKEIVRIWKKGEYNKV